MFSIVCEFFTIFEQKKCKKVKLKGQVKNTELGKKSAKHEILIEIFLKQAVWVFMWLSNNFYKYWIYIYHKIIIPEKSDWNPASPFD